MKRKLPTANVRCIVCDDLFEASVRHVKRAQYCPTCKIERRRERDREKNARRRINRPHKPKTYPTIEVECIDCKKACQVTTNIAWRKKRCAECQRVHVNELARKRKRSDAGKTHARPRRGTVNPWAFYEITSDPSGAYRRGAIFSGTELRTMLRMGRGDGFPRINDGTVLTRNNVKYVITGGELECVKQKRNSIGTG